MSIIVVTGTGTDVGKTMVTAAIANLAKAAGKRVAVCKPAQTGLGHGEGGDLAEIALRSGPITTLELRRYPDPLSPEAAARTSGLPTVHASEITAAVTQLSAAHDLVLVEGAGGLLVRFDETGSTIADVAWALGAPVVIVASAGLGSLNSTALTAAALAHRGVESMGVVIGSWPERPNLAERSNLNDLPVAARGPLIGALPAGICAAERDDFSKAAYVGLSPWLGGQFDEDEFRDQFL